MANTVTPLICSECGEGNYGADRSARTFRCGSCFHAVTEYDVRPYLDEGESLAVVDGILAVGA